ncbi:MAG: phenylalanine--tRNA ligase subunit beta [Erysipelotrichaceae bacterium]|nr:phenylalanine--tRNA ligase subunit beta [Erysipelotrichaceae bacterium]
MLASYKLLKQFVNLDGISPSEIANKLTFAGLEVEEVSSLAQATNLVIGQIVEVVDHPDSDHLHVLKVNLGEKYGVEQIVCGAPNVRVGLKVIVARPGAVLGKDCFTISKSLKRGVESNGMCCALNELGVDKLYLRDEQINGIEELPEDAIVGNEEVLEYLGLDDVVFDINVLANRSDCLAIYSIAKELGALFDREVNIPTPIKYDEIDSNITCGSSTSDCPQFSIKVVKDVVTKESPLWMQRFLMAEGVRSINNIVDIGNYVMLLTGQPLHMYDLDKLQGNNFVVKNDYEGPVVALDEKEYQVEKGDLVVTNNDIPVCLAGTMGLLNVAVDDKTVNIAIEAANFKGSTVRQTGNRLGLSSESSARFAKGINPYQDEFVLDLACQLLVELADAKVVSKNVRYSTLKGNETQIECSVSYINKRLGTSFTREEIVNVLTKLMIKVIDVDGDNFVALPPDHRIDLKVNADLSEEIIRYIGFGAIKSQLPLMPTTTGGYTPSQQKRLKIRESLIAHGLNEVLTYALVSPKMSEEFILLNKDESYVIMNPMTVEHSIVRRGLVSSVLDIVKYNLDHQQKDLALFEVASIDTKSQHYEELVVALNGSKSLRGSLEKRPYDFYDIHGILESILTILGIDKNRYKEERLTDSKYYHPGRSTKIMLGKDIVGVCGQVHPSVSKDFKETYILNLNLTKLLELRTSQVKMSQISKYPSVTRDIALVVKENVFAGDIIRTIKKFGKSLVKDVQIFDVYQGEFLEEGTKSIAISIVYQDDTKTLVDSVISETERNILDALFKEYKAELRK